MTISAPASSTVTRPLDCPCGGAAPVSSGGASSNQSPPRFAQCCGRYIDGGEAAPTAWELMRSRYSAYVLGATDYLRASWDPATCPADLDVDPADPAAPKWLGLQIKRYALLDPAHAEVEFVARFKTGGRAHRLHETSRFARGEDDRWRYVDGDVSER